MISTFLDPASYQFHFYSAPPLLVGIGIFLLGMATLVRERGSQVSKLFALLTTSITVWLVSIALTIAAVDPEAARLWSKIEHVGVHVIPAALFHQAVTSMGTYQRNRKLVWAGWLLSALFVISTVTSDLLIGDLYRYDWGHYPRYGWANVFFLVYFAFMLWASLRQYWIAYRNENRGTTHYRRARALLIAFSIGYLGSVDYLPAYGFDFYPLGFIPILIFLALVARAISRYRLVAITPAFAVNEIVNTMSEALLVLDHESKVRLVNPAAADLFGRPAEELADRPVTDVIEGLTLPDSHEILQKGGAIRTRESVYRPATGENKFLSISASTLHDPARGLVATVCVIRDVTERKKAEERILKEAARAEALLRVAARLNAQLELDGVLDTVCEETARALDVPFAVVSLYDEKETLFYPVAAYGLPDDYLNHMQPIDARPSYEDAESYGAITIIPDVLAIPALPNAELYRRLNLRTGVGVRLWREEELVGHLSVATADDVRAFSKDELALLQGLANQAAQALTNAHLYEQAQRRLNQVQALRDIDTAINTGPDLDASLDVLLKQIVLHLDVDAASILLLNPQQRILEYAAGKGFRDDLAHLRLDLDDSFAGQAAKERRVFSIPDLREGEHAARRTGLLAREDFVSYFAVPLIAKDEVKAVLEIFHRQRLLPDPEWLDFMETLAGQAALAIDNATLLAQVKAHARQIQQIVDTVPEGLLLLNEDRQVALANPAANDYLMLLANEALTPEQETMGAKLSHLGDVPIEELLNPWPQEAPAREVKIEQPEQRVFEIMAQPMQAGEDSGGWVLVLRDVTVERQIMERARQQERLVAVGQLAAGIAHDFNNIMMVVVLYAQMLQRTAQLTPKDRERLETIQQQARHATNLIDQILDFSRRSVIERQPLDLLPFLQEFLRLLERTLPENVLIEFKKEEGSYVASADATRLQQILMNLAVNARDAMPRGGKLEVSLTTLTVGPESKPPVPDMAPGQWLTLAISDSGSGIKPEILPRLFEPFFTTKEPGQGTGLGLAQVYGIVKQHEGHINVESKIGEGTTFTIYLPAIEKAIAEGAAAEPAPEELAGAETILVAEDDVPAQEALRSILEAQGYEILMAEDGRRALELFRESEEDVDLVLSDMVMPKMGSLELYEALKLEQPEVKMVVITGYPLADEGRALLDQGILSWLPKPFSEKQILSKVRAALDAE